MHMEQGLVATMGCPSARGGLGAAVHLEKMVGKNPGMYSTETHYLKSQPGTGEIVVLLYLRAGENHGRWNS